MFVSVVYVKSLKTIIVIELYVYIYIYNMGLHKKDVFGGAVWN
jgi:hypothetical protein